MTAWAPVIRLRVIAIAAMSVAALFHGLDRIGLVVGVLGVALVLQPVVGHLFTTTKTAWQCLFVLDLALSTLIVLFEPSLAINQALLTTGLIGASATCFGVRGFFLYSASALSALAIVLSRSDIDIAAQVFIAVAIIGMVFGGWMLRFRLTAATLVEDLGRTVDAAGGLFFTGVVGDPMPSFLGDMESVLGWRPEDGPKDLIELIHPDDLDNFWIPDDDLVPGTEIERTARMRTRSGDWRWMREVSRVVDRDGVLEIRGMILDHTEHVDGLRKATAEASTDSLTGLANRRMLVDLLDRQTVDGRHLALLDLNSFKRVNDTLGHAAGDELLIVVARRISSKLRPGDLAVRLGGDEFAVVLDAGAAEPSPIEVVERVLHALTTPISLNGVVVNTSASAGVVVEQGGASGSTQMLRRADLAMYEAKRNGTGWELFTAALDRDHGRKAQLIRDLPEALQRAELRLFYQPIVDVSTGAVVGAEGLARWMHPTFGLLEPADFLDVVLVSSQAGTFTRAMVADGLAMAQRLEELGADLRVAVNVPVGMLEDDDCCDWFFQRCAAAGLPPSRMVFEISERELHVEGRADDAIERLSMRGVEISIDDFGTGHATFDRLRWRRVGQLKLERSLVQGAARDPRDALILANVVKLAKELGFAVVGEGVETEAQRRQLEHAGVDYAQGFLFAAAMEAELFLASVDSPAQRLVAPITDRAI